MFGFVSIQGMQILARVDFEHNEHNFLIAAVSIAAGVGLNNSTLFNGLPTGFQMFFANGIVVASVLAIVLNAIFKPQQTLISHEPEVLGSSVFDFKETYSRVEEEKILFDEKRVRIMYVTYHFKERLRLFLSLFLPILIYQLANYSASFVDTAMTGQYRTLDLAGVSQLPVCGIHFYFPDEGLSLR